MRLGQFALLTSAVLALTLPAVAATRTHRGPTASRKAVKHVAAKPKFQSQRAIDDERASQIQAALIRAGYLTGEPTGHWDAASEAAMQKVQADNGWQTKLVPDSRALIKLGLGPSTSNVASLVRPVAAGDSIASSNSVAQAAR
jgi:peptidoglycan hydrolase-like protein with peptidoglycan-binding domain